MRLPIQDFTDTHELAPGTYPLDGVIVATLQASLPDLKAVYRYGSAVSIHEREDSTPVTHMMQRCILNRNWTATGGYYLVSNRKRNYGFAVTEGVVASRERSVAGRGNPELDIDKLRVTVIDRMLLYVYTRRIYKGE